MSNCPFSLGDVLAYSWGYDQTNVDFFQVVKVSASGKSVQIQELKQSAQDDGFMCGKCKPLPGQFVEGSKPLQKVVKSGYQGKPVLAMSYGCASKVDPNESQRYSYYA